MVAETNLKTTLAIFLLFVLSAASATVHAKIIFVDVDAAGANNGSSWTDAYNHLQDALAAAASGDEIRVAQGIYKPDQGAGITPGDREATFQLINGVTIKGGYAGFGQPDPDARDIAAYEAILSGDILGDDGPDFTNYAENSYHVVVGSGTNDTAVLNGFTITGGGITDHCSDLNKGGGMYIDSGSPTILNCTFIANAATDNCGGGGAAMFNRSSNPIVRNCAFIANAYIDADDDGGGAVANKQSHPTFEDCIFTENSSDGYGGAMLNYKSNPVLDRCIFLNNYAAMEGGAMMNRNSSPTLNDCTFADNITHYDGGAITNTDWSSPTLSRCAFIANRTQYAPGQGGAISNNYNDELELFDCLFAGNAASVGGAIHSYFGTIKLTNCTFTGNVARVGGALNCRAEDTTLTNCILWANTAERGKEIYFRFYYNPATLTVNFSNIQKGQSGIHLQPENILVWGLGNIDADPCFVQPGYRDANGTPYDPWDDVWVDGDYHLLPDSPCIDAGDPNYITAPDETDLDGKPRVIGGRIDMGAYESPISAEVRILPRTINLASKGKWITSYIWLPEEYNVADIDPNSVFLEEIKAGSLQVDEQEQVAIAGFSREELRAILSIGQVELTITGRLTDGTPFEAADIIRVLNKAAGKPAK